MSDEATALEAYASSEVTMLTGMTYRQLDHCISSGLVTPSLAEGVGSGNRRMFSPSDVAVLRVVTALRAMGVRGQNMKKAIALVNDAPVKAGYLILPTSGSPTIHSDLTLLQHLDACCVVNLNRLVGID